MPKVKRYICPEYLRSILDYDPHIGVFRWKVDRGGRSNSKIKAGTIAGSMNEEGYWVIGIDGQVYGAHRLAWAWMHGKWPDRIVDHDNQFKTDNRILNLRLADEKQSVRNRKSKNKHGLKGVTVKRGLYRARIMVDGKSIHIGYYLTKEEAHAAYVEKARELHGRFASD